MEYYIKDKDYSIHNMNHNYDFTIIGVGGTGSRLAEKLAELNYMLLNSNKPGINMKLIDPDIVELKNIGRQRFKPHQIGMFKTDAIAQTLARDYQMRNIVCINESLNENHFNNIFHYGRNEIIISCIDNFEARYLSYKIAKKLKDSYLIDVGNDKDYGQIFLYRKDHLKHTFDVFGKDEFIKQEKETTFSCNNYEDQFKEQGHFINEAMALYAIEMIKDFIINDVLYYNAIFVNLKEKKTSKGLYK